LAQPRTSPLTDLTELAMISHPTSPADHVLPGKSLLSWVSAACEPVQPTFGVEEEFALVDPATGHVATVAPQVIAGCADAHGVVAELMTYMLETRTPVSRSVRELRQALLARRKAVATQAARRGAVVVASGVTPLRQPQPPPLSEENRYRELAARFPGPISAAGTLGCHVHVAVPSRAAGVEVLRRTRRWIPALIALTANSPIYDGHDTGWAAWRYRLASRWPTACPALPVDSDAAYDDMITTAIVTGDALDLRNVYFLIRLSPRFPTVEVRLADVLPTAEEAAAYAGLVRALVVQALRDAEAGLPARDIDQARLVAACEAAARGGLTGAVIDVATDQIGRGWDLVDELLRYLLPSLARDPECASVWSTIELIRLIGGGADRQRKLWHREDGPPAFTRSLAHWTTAPVLHRARAMNTEAQQTGLPAETGSHEH
jgi:glutamate---cysteine ligase / carboxylate-amine ligase